MKILFLLLLSLSALAQDTLEELRWYLSPNGQRLTLSIDDLHDEILTADPKLDWGFQAVKAVTLKRDVVVAVIDGGMEIDHPDLSGAIAYNTSECFEGSIIPPMKEDLDGNGYKSDCAGWNFVENNNRAEDKDGHGTHVTGIIRYVTRQAQGHKVKFLPLRVFAPDEGRRTVSASAPLPVRLQKAFEYAIARNVDVIHMSVGWPKSFMSFELEQAIQKAIAQGILIVSAAGNSSQRATIYPCQMKGVVCVGALRPNGDLARFSNWGSQVDILAPGEKILSTIPHTIAPLHISRKGHDYKNGTSQAAPFISGALAILKGAMPEESADSLISRLLLSADQGFDGKSLKGEFHLDRALKLEARAFIMPEFKGLHSVTVNQEGEFGLSLNFKNRWLEKLTETPVQISCHEGQIIETEFSLAPVASSAEVTQKLTGKLTDTEASELNCKLILDGESFTLKLKVLRSLGKPLHAQRVLQEELLVAATRMGAKSRFMTLDTLKGAIAQPLYYVPGEVISLYKLDKKVGPVPLKKDCTFLRMTQVDLNRDGENDVMMESTCEKTHLLFQFFDSSLKELFPSVKYRPTLVNLNYDDFELQLQNEGPPSFRFLNVGLGIPSGDPWDSDVMGKRMHLYELVPVKDGENLKYDIRVLENPKQWAKSLGLRFLPSYRVLNLFEGKLLIQMGTKTAWVDLKTQTATYAHLDHLLLLGSKKQALLSGNGFVLQSFLTPYEYRGYVMEGVALRYNVTDRQDPMLDILGTIKDEEGFTTILRSFQHLIYVKYDASGKRLSETKALVDRFDFLTAQDLISTVVNIVHTDNVLQLVDGTKVNTNYVDVMVKGKKVSFEVPFACSTQQPVLFNGVTTLPLFCGKTRTEFEMRFFPLSNL